VWDPSDKKDKLKKDFFLSLWSTMGERPDEDYDYLFKVVVTGDSGVGKV
jgi:hypothetical protein